MSRPITEQPECITLGKIECVIMPNGEVIILGKTIGYFKDLQEFLFIEGVVCSDES